MNENDKKKEIFDEFYNKMCILIGEYKEKLPDMALMAMYMHGQHLYGNNYYTGAKLVEMLANQMEERTFYAIVKLATTLVETQKNTKKSTAND